VKRISSRPIWRDLRVGPTSVHLTYANGDWVELVGRVTRAREAPSAIELEIDLSNNLRAHGFAGGAKLLLAEGLESLRTVQLKDSQISRELSRWRSRPRGDDASKPWVLRLRIGGDHEYPIALTVDGHRIWLDVAEEAAGEAGGGESRILPV
jgi:hypothetical protein